MRSYAGFFVIVTLLFLTACGGGSASSGGSATPTPTPSLTPTPTPIPTPSPTPSAVSVVVAPASVTLSAGTPQSFTATVSGSANTSVTWEVNGIVGGNVLFGTIDASGQYLSPAAPTALPIAITAVAKADISKSDTAHATISFSNASLIGNYTFLITVGDTNPVLPGFGFAGGTFHADGNGNLTAGIEDVNTRDGGPVTDVSFTGTYSVSANGRGSATIQTATGSALLKFVLTSSDRGQLIEFDGLSAASGFVQRQDATAIATISGNYVFSLFGDHAGGPIGIIGMLTADGSGGLSGTEIVNDNGVGNTLAITGTYSIGSSGRGIATVTNALNTTQNFVFYIASKNVVNFIGVDTAALPRAAGTAFLQTGVASMTSSAFFVNGMFVSGDPFSADGRFDINNAGAVSGVFDSFAGVTHSSGSALGTYSMNPDGSGQISVLNPGPAFKFWMFSPTQAVVLVLGTIPTNQSAVATGFIFAEQGAPFSALQLQGNYAFGAAVTTGQAAVGQIVFDGIGSFAGKEDSNNGLAADVIVTATWALASNGRGSGTIVTTGSLGSTEPLAFYPISPFEIVFANTSGIGLAEKQCSDCH